MSVMTRGGGLIYCTWLARRLAIALECRDLIKYLVRTVCSHVML